MRAEACKLPDTKLLRAKKFYPSGETVFSEEELSVIEQMAMALNEVGNLEERREMGREFVRELWPDEQTFISRQHVISTKKPGLTTLLQWNHVQRGFYEIADQMRAEGRPVRIITLKARQLGQSTGIQSWNYHQCDQHANRSAATISYDEKSTVEMFDKAHKIHQSLWFPQQTARKGKDTIELANGSKFHTATAGNLDSGRSFTFHHLHISELPSWPNAADVLDGLLQAVPDEPDTSIFVESTAQGTDNDFYTMWKLAESGQSDYYPYFAPWYWDATYQDLFRTKDDRNRFRDSLRPADHVYMETYGLTLEQMAWRRRIIRSKLRGSEARFRQEYPACADEAFLASGRPALNQDAIAELAQGCRKPTWTGSIWYRTA